MISLFVLISVFFVLTVQNSAFPQTYLFNLIQGEENFLVREAVFASFLRCVTISGAKVEILKDFQCQLDINFIQISCSFPV